MQYDLLCCLGVGNIEWQNLWRTVSASGWLSTDTGDCRPLCRHWQQSVREVSTGTGYQRCGHSFTSGRCAATNLRARLFAMKCGAEFMHRLNHKFDFVGVNVLMYAMAEVKNMPLTLTVTFEHTLYLFAYFAL